jgi:hypothetical protein
MANHALTTGDHSRFQAARAQGQALAADASALVNARYDQPSDTVVLSFRGGGTMAIPRSFIPGLEHQRASTLASVEISPAGDALRWASIDVDIYVPGVVERAFGTRLFAAAAGQRGGRRRTKAKIAAARQNGAKGGRPRKPSAA